MGGVTKFLNCKIDLSKKVFEPRIETEFWVGKAIKEIQRTINNGQRAIIVLDIFAGSGCIGIAALKNTKNAVANFADISKEAVKQIKINLELNKIKNERYKIYQSNLFEKVKNRKYDVIFANPPYVALDRISQVQKEVLQKEPRPALFAGKDGMFWIKRFLKEAKKYLKKRGVIYLEFDPLQKEKLKKILEKGKFKFQFRKDQFKKYRWLKALN
jgi:release factor glutamine methyltransferase